MSCILILAQASSGILDSARETADTFGWNLWQFLSQVISFTIVALLLRRFAYTPILKVLEERRRQIAEGLLNAEKIRQQLAEAEQRQAEILAKANAQAQKMIDEARESAGHRRSANSRRLLRPRNKFGETREASAIEHEQQMN